VSRGNFCALAADTEGRGGFQPVAANVIEAPDQRR